MRNGVVIRILAVKIMLLLSGIIPQYMSHCTCFVYMFENYWGHILGMIIVRTVLEAGCW